MWSKKGIKNWFVMNLMDSHNDAKKVMTFWDGSLLPKEVVLACL